MTLYTIVGGGHRWPGDDVPWWTLPDPLVSDLDATDVIWAFFATHPRRP